jgi:hypothetical protein
MRLALGGLYEYFSFSVRIADSDIVRLHHVPLLSLDSQNPPIVVFLPAQVIRKRFGEQGSF